MLRRNEAGFSLLELVVVAAIIGMIATPLTLFTIRGMNAYNFIQVQSDTAVDIGTLTDRVTRVVRGATSIDTASPQTLIVYGYFSPQDTVIKKIAILFREQVSKLALPHQ